MPVPKAAMDEQCNLPAGENQVRRPGELPDVEPEPEAEPMGSAPDEQLGLRSFSSYPAHQFRTAGWGNDVYHKRYLSLQDGISRQP
jgi:hypothetical protein